ncbi:MAG: Crp/Fnr family transcriptional regulator [Chloroflexi bacterium]|nr:Crp/Fnr family transcriptional regulator [Chloroflexota bacterium]
MRLMKGLSVAIVEHLHRIDVFGGLSREEIGPLFKGVQEREYPSGAFLYSPGDSGERLFVLKTGRVDIYRLTPTGKRLIVRRLAAGTIFGEMGLLGQSLQGCFAEATEQCLVCIATREHLLGVLRQHPEVALRILEVVGNHLRQTEDRLEQALFSPVQQRLANFLLTNMDSSSGTVAGYTHEEIGDTIGALRPTVTETLCLLRDQGLVAVERKRIRVTNRDKLQEIAQGADAR